MLYCEQNKPSLYYVTVDYPPDHNAGSARAHALVKGLSAHSEVRVISTKRAKATNGERITNLPIDNFQNKKGLIKRTYRELIFSCFVLLKLLFAPQNTILVIASPPFFLLLVYVLLPRKRGQLRVLDVRDIYPDVFVDAGLLQRSSILFRVLAAVERWAYTRSDLVLTVCDSLAEKIRQRAPSTNLQLVLNGYGDSFHRDSNGEDSTTVARPFTIISHGNFGRFQNVDLLNRLVKRTGHLPLRYRFVGFGANFDQITPSPNVEIENAVSHEEIPALLAEADLGLSVRSSDSVGRNAIPVKVLEYLGMGIPSLVFPVMPDLGVLAQSGAIRQFESDQIEDAVAFLTNVSRRGPGFEEMRHAAKQVRGDYSRQCWVEVAVEKIFEAHKEQEL